MQNQKTTCQIRVSLLAKDTGPMADLIVVMLAEINVHLIQIAVDGKISLKLFKQDPTGFDIIVSD